MAKKKLVRFAEMIAFDNVVQAVSDEVLNKRHDLYGRWAGKFFGSPGPIVLELGCGKGEYTIALARLFPGMNFLGVDIKGARIWKGAKYAFENKIQNVGFLRTRIEFITSFFASDEIEQVWLTFPDPQPSRTRKRLTSPAFLNRYRGFLRKGGLVHLKTDNMELFDYTLRVIRANSLELLMSTEDIYHSAPNDKLLSIRTYYEQQFLDQGKPIAYLRFRIDCQREIKEPDADQ